MEQIKIRNAVCGNAEIFAVIQTESWKTAFDTILSAEELNRHLDVPSNTQMYQRVLADSRYHGLLLSVNEKPHCIACWSAYRAENCPKDLAELICIHSLKENRRKGYGSLMMEQVCSDIKAAGYTKVCLWVFEQNYSAKKFYEKHGFTLTEERNRAFGADEVLYQKIL